MAATLAPPPPTVKERQRLPAADRSARIGAMSDHKQTRPESRRWLLALAAGPAWALGMYVAYGPPEDHTWDQIWVAAAFISFAAWLALGWAARAAARAASNTSENADQEKDRN